MNFSYLLNGSIWPLGLIQSIVLLAIAPLFTGSSRAIRARMHNRHGPGVLQEYRDITKLLKRQTVLPPSSGATFRSMPYLLTGGLLVIACGLPVITLASPIRGAGDVITLIYLFAIVRFVFIIAGLDTGSPFTGISASREAVLGVLTEPVLILSLWVAALVAGSTSCEAIAVRVRSLPDTFSLPLVLAGMACAFASYVEMGKLPFDLAEAEQELQEGVLTEYSGAALGVLKMGISLKQLVVLQLFLGLFFPFGQITTLTPLSMMYAVLLCLMKLFIAGLVLALFENSVARLRFLNTSHTTWVGFGLACLALISWLVTG